MPLLEIESFLRILYRIRDNPRKNCPLNHREICVYLECMTDLWEQMELLDTPKADYLQPEITFLLKALNCRISHKHDNEPLFVPHGNYSVVSGTYKVAKPDNTVLEQVEKSAPEHKHWVEEYKVVRYHTEHYYYRYVWMSGRKLHHVHIRGGNVKSPIAQQKKAAVEIAIAALQSPSEIEKIIRS